MRKWYKEDWKFTITVLKVGNDGRAEHCRLGFEPGDEFSSTYECPADFCPKCMSTVYPLMTAVRSGGDLRELGGKSSDSIEFPCPDGPVLFRMVAEKTEV